MTVHQFITRLEDIRQKDKNCAVYFKLLKLTVTEVLDMINSVDGQIAEDEMDIDIEKIHETLRQHLNPKP